MRRGSRGFSWLTINLKALYLLLMLTLLSGCAKTAHKELRIAADPGVHQQAAASGKDAMSKEDLLFSLLRNEYSYWRGTPYRLGGNNKNGIDCSAFVQAVFKNSFNIAVARTTSRQLKLGSPVTADNLKVADLVFFKIRRGVRHVGIYIGAQQFLHASTSQGVMISSLHNSYWQSKYWQARRILD